MSSFVQKATPFFEHILIGLAFASMGYVFFWTFNTSFISILGMAAVCFGGLKILVGVIIYGGWLFALIFRPEYLKKKEAEEELRRSGNTAEQEVPEGTWLQVHAPFVAKHWVIILELSILFAGFLMILITKNTR
jgi:hypothetical protein